MIPGLAHLNFKERKNAILQMEKANLSFSERLAVMPLAVDAPSPSGCFSVWRSQEFFVQAYHVPGGVIRLSINRTHVDPATMRWLDRITWDDLQSLKEQAGYGDHEAVEVYPPGGAVVNVANVRHLWVFPAGIRMPFSWGKDPAS